MIGQVKVPLIFSGIFRETGFLVNAAAARRWGKKNPGSIGAGGQSIQMRGQHNGGGPAGTPRTGTFLFSAD